MDWTQIEFDKTIPMYLTSAIITLSMILMSVFSSLFTFKVTKKATRLFLYELEGNIGQMGQRYGKMKR